MKYIVLIFINLIVVFGLQAQSRISGTITDEETAAKLQGTTVFIPELNKGTVSDEDGYYHLDHLPSGTITIEFSYMGFQTKVKKMNFTGESLIIDISLSPTIIHSQEVVISSSSYTTQHENAVKIETIGLDQIEVATHPDFIGAIAEVPGVDMISKGNGITKPVIRGLSNSNIVLLNNGVKLENYQFSENHPYTIDGFGVERVEIIKGPASLLYGSDAVGGIINVIPEKPAPSGRVLGDFGTQYFSNSKGISSSLGIKGAGKHVNWGIRGGQKNHMDYISGNGLLTVTNTRFDEKSLKLNAGLNKKYGSFQLFYNYNAMKLGMTTPDAFTLINTNERKYEYWYQDLTNHLITSRNKLFFGRYKIGANLAWQYNKRKLHTDENNEVNMGLNVFSYDVKTWLPSSEDTEYILGVQGAFKENKNDDGHNRVLPDYSQNDVALIGWVKHTHKNNLSMQAGARFEYRDLSVPEQEKAGHSHEEGHEDEEEEHMEAFSRTYSNFSFSLGGTWQMSHDFLWRFNMASAYRTPNVAELTQDGIHGSRFEQGNLDLKSQRSYEGDLSLHYHSEILEIDLAGFYNHINDYIYLAPTEEYDEELQIYRYSQATAYLYGVESVISISPIKWLHLDAVGSYLRGKQKSGDYLPFIPQDKIKLEFRIEPDHFGVLKEPWIQLGSGFAFAQENPAQFETATENYFLVDAGVGFNFMVRNQKLSFSVTGSNLLDELYIDHLSTLKLISQYNMGRNITFHLKVPFGIMN